MKKTTLCTLAAMLAATSLNAQNTPTTQMERLGRGVVALPAKSSGMFVSWRMLGTDDEDAITFDLLRDGTTIAKDLYATCYSDSRGQATSTYQVVTKVSGEPVDTSEVVTPWADGHLTIALQRPANGTGGCTYSPNDCSVGDVDGDGQYEIFLKWDPSNSHDNSENGTTGNVYIDCYRLDGTRLWRIDLGQNIRAGAHYTQFMVYDFDGDGRAEMMCKTAPGSKDGLGGNVNRVATDETIRNHSTTSSHRNSNGHITSGPEYLTVFEGLTGQALHTTWYLPGRAGTGGSNEDGSELGKVNTYPSGFWGDNGYNRSERYLAAVAYINGQDRPACAIFSRGYYTRAYVWAVSFDGTRLHTEWLHASPSATQSVVFSSNVDASLSYPKFIIDGDELQRKGLRTAAKNTGGTTSADALPNPDNGRTGITGSNTLYSNGNHNLSIADVDGDGCDEIIWGAAALNNDGTMLYSTGMGHGDAIHLSDLLPDRPGLELFDIHEERVRQGSWDVHDAATGEIIYIGGTGAPNGVDNGRGMSADISADFRGFEFWSSDDRTPRRATDGKSTSLAQTSQNFRIYWNGDLQDELLDGHYARNSSNAFDHVDHIYITEGGNSSRIVDMTNRSLCNTTKMTPNLQADLLGDWREELVLWDYQNPTELYIHATNIETGYRIPTLMHDHVYRMGIAWQNTAYNQPPHLGYYLPDAMMPRLLKDEKTFNVTVGEPFEMNFHTRYAKSGILSVRKGPDNKLTTEIKGSFTTSNKIASLSGTCSLEGDYTIGFRLTGYGGESVVDTIMIHAVQADAIDGVVNDATSQPSQTYDALGRRVDSSADRLPKGIYIIRKNDKTFKINKP